MTGDRSDPYAVLGLTSQATPKEIRRAYRTVMRQTHPETRPQGGPSADAEADVTLQQAMSAYSVLGDPASRARHDHRTTPHRTSSPIRVDVVLRHPPGPADSPPIQAGPVRWHRSR